MKGPHMKMPTMPKIAKPAGIRTKIHPSAQPRIRVPQGIANTGDAAPAPWLPDVGKI